MEQNLAMLICLTKSGLNMMKRQKMKLGFMRLSISLHEKNSAVRKAEVK